MTLRVALKLEPEEHLVQADPLLEVTLSNAGTEPITLEHPWYSENFPRFLALNLKTGEETRSSPGSARLGPPVRVALAPGKSLGSVHSLRRSLALPAPGLYEITALVEDSKSAPARLRLAPAVPRNLNLDTVQGIVSYGVWVNLASDPPEIVRSRFMIAPGGGVADSRRIAPAGSSARPVVSLPPNGKDRSRHWIAWIEGNSLVTSHVSDDLGILPPLKMGWGEAKLVSPLFSEPTTDIQERAPGWALALAGDALVGVRLTATGSSVGPQARVVRPAWLRSHARSNGSRFVTTMESRPGEVVLSSIAWSDQKFEPARPLQTWTGGFVAADALLDLEDRVRGGTLMLRKDRLVLSLWELEPDNEFREREVLELPEEAPRQEPRLRVSPTGAPILLLRDANQVWLYDGGLRPPAPPAGTSRLPVEVAFLGSGEPVFVCAESGTGWGIVRADGSPLPERRD